MLLRLPTAQRPTTPWSTMKEKNRFDSTLRTLSRDCFCTPGQDAQERVRYATECCFGILDRQHVSSSLREEWKYTLSHVRCQPNCNDMRWFNPSSVALCRRCSEPRWLCVKRDDRRSLDDLPKMDNGAGVPMEAGRRLASGPFVTRYYLRRGSGGEIRRQGFLGIDFWVCSPFGRVLL